MVKASKSRTGEQIRVPKHYWGELRERDPKVVCDNAMALAYPSRGFILTVMNEEILVEVTQECLMRLRGKDWESMDYPLLELIALVYLLNAGPEPISHQLISVHELKDAHFFQGPHELKMRPVLEHYGKDPHAFREAAGSLGGEPQDLADAAYRIYALPKVPLYYLLWVGDEEFEPRLSILFDKTIERHLSADAIWGLVSLVSNALLKTPGILF